MPKPSFWPVREMVTLETCSRIFTQVGNDHTDFDPDLSEEPKTLA